jgi:sigma-B regulation protein RsbU (phosphoserine phosphatase)
MKRNTRKFSSKIFVAIIALIVLVVCAVIAIFYYSLFNVRGEIGTLFDSMREDINQTASTTINKYNDEMMEYILDGQANAIEFVMTEHNEDLNYLVHIIEQAYKRNIRATHLVSEPKPENEGKLSVQLMYEEEVDLNSSEVKYDIEILSTLQNELIYNVQDSIDKLRCYIETESGLLIMADKITKDKFEKDGSVKYATFRSEDWYIEVVDPQKMYVSNVSIDDLTGKQIIVLYKPYFDEQGKKKGIVCFEFDVDSISENSWAVKDTNIYDIFVADGENNIVFDTSHLVFPDDEKTRTRSKNFLEKTRANGSGIESYKFKGIEYKSYYKKLSFSDWMIFVTLNYDTLKDSISNLENILDNTNRKVYEEIDSDNRDFAKAILIFSFVLLVSAFFFAKFLANMLSIPLNKFTNDISKMDASDLKPVPVVDSSEELYTLSTTYNNMIDKMKTYVDNIEKITEEKESINAELKVAKRIQQDMLPNEFKELYNRKDIDIYGMNIPEVEIGGDFYNYILVGNKLILIIADVSGSGIPASLFMAKTNALLNSAISWTTSPRTMLSYVNHELYKSNTEYYFVTIAIYTIDLKTRHVISVNAGHEDSIIIRKNGEVSKFKEKRTSPIGVSDNLRLEENEFDLNEGDTLFLFTDGVIEAVNKNEELFGENRLLDIIKVNRDKTIKELISNIKNEIDKFSAGLEQYDDITMLALRVIDRNETYNESLVYNFEETFVGSYDIIDRIDSFLSQKLAVAYEENVDKFKPYINKFEVCIEEIVVNILDYGYKKDEEKWIKMHVTIDRNDDKVTISCIDGGKKFDPTSVDEPNILKDARDRKLGGLGIFITRKFMDLMNYEYIDGKNILTLVKYL